VQDWIHPKTLKSLRGFLGITGYYRKFVKNSGKISTPLISLLEKNDFGWNDVATKAFVSLTMCINLVLAMHDFNNNSSLKCDASGRSLGVVLMQEGSP
jgi:hypothetical protein